MPTGNRIVVQKGTHWPATDPVVKMRPHLFSRDSRYGMLYSVEPDGYSEPEGFYDDIEAAAASPGEKRSVRRS